ncbi:MAG: hypothetical protein K5770_17715 [Lachnospiraceae bacterium]|nr:hypothetical protein [Lachnospiraceae bacterium]
MKEIKIINTPSVFSILTILLVLFFALDSPVWAGETKNSNSEFKIVADHIEVSAYLKYWSNAFIERDCAKLSKMMDKDAKASIKSDDYGWDPKTGVFGWSSPWPVSCRLSEYGNGKAVILYYAKISDPHISVWREELEYSTQFSEMGEVSIQIEKETLQLFEEISDYSSFERAYPDGLIEGTGIDYIGNNDLRAGLYDAAQAHKSDKKNEFPYYNSLYSPETAVLSLLNLSTDPKTVTVNCVTDKATKSVYAKVRFLKDKKEVAVRMEPLYGKDGVWAPRNISDMSKNDPADSKPDSEAYSVVFDSYKEAVNKKWDLKKMWSNGVCTLVDKTDSSCLRYSFTDLNHDGINELLILDNGTNASENTYLYALYTRKGSRIIPVSVNSHPGFSAGAYLAVNGLIDQYSVGTGYMQNAYCYIDPFNDFMLTPLQMITMDCSSSEADFDNCWYISSKKNTIFRGPLWDKMPDDFTSIPEEEAESIIEAYRFKGDIETTPLSRIL